MNSNFPGIKESKGIPGQVPVTCVICGDTFTGVLFQHNFIPIFSKLDEETNFDVQAIVTRYGAKTLLVYECYHCHTHVCSNCVPKLKRLNSSKSGSEKETFEVKGHKYILPACPSCNKSFNSNTTSINNLFISNYFYIVGRFPPEVLTRNANSSTDSLAGIKFAYRLTVEAPVKLFKNQVHPTERCSLCMSSSVSHILKSEQKQYRGVNHLPFIFQVVYPLCEECNSILTDKINIHWPGDPVNFHIKENFLTSQRNIYQISFVNPLFGELWLEKNKVFVPTEFVPIIPHGQS